jgi:hypothetical protein
MRTLYVALIGALLMVSGAPAAGASRRGRPGGAVRRRR